MRKHLYFQIAAVLALLFSISACSGDGVRVTGVTLNGAASVYAGATSKLSETVLPENAANKTVSWSSSDNSVATVADGTVCGVKEGYANITVTTEDGGFTAVCLVAVSIPPPVSVNLSKTTLALIAPWGPPATVVIPTTPGAYERLTAAVMPAEADQTVTWMSSNPNVAAVAGGVVVAVGAGTADITARAVNGITSNACAVSVEANNVAVTGVTISPASLSLIAGSDVNHRTARLSAQVYPPNAPATNPVTPIIWTSSDPARATVSQAGLVEALAAGDVTITACYGTAADASKGDCAVKIRNQ